MISRAKAPVRVSFGGGGTDVPPYCVEHGGQVVSTTITKFLHVTVKKHHKGGRTHVVRLFDLDREVRFPVGDQNYDGQADLVKACLGQFDLDEGVEVTVHSDLPPGSGMGTSSSLVVALLGAVSGFLGRGTPKAADAARLAYHVERDVLGHRGGYQDQYAAAFGGFNRISFGKEVVVTPLRLSRAVLNELKYRLLLVFTGRTHLSAEVQKEVMGKDFNSMPRHVDFLEGMAKLKEVAGKMRDVLESGDLARLDEFGHLLHEGWVAKKSLSEKISTSDVEKLYLSARSHGAVGGKLLGAGGGGHLLLFVDPEKRREVVSHVKALGGKVVSFEFEERGLQVWAWEDER